MYHYDITIMIPISHSRQSTRSSKAQPIQLQIITIIMWLNKHLKSESLLPYVMYVFFLFSYKMWYSVSLFYFWSKHNLEDKGAAAQNLFIFFLAS